MAIEKKSLISNGGKTRSTKNTVKAAAPASKLRTALTMATAIRATKPIALARPIAAPKAVAPKII